MNPNYLSAIPGRVFLYVMGLRILLAVTDVTAAVIALYDPQLFDYVGRPLDRLFPLTPWVFAISFLAFGVWLYQYHRDLGRLFPGYPIQPWGAPQTSALILLCSSLQAAC